MAYIIVIRKCLDDDFYDATVMMTMLMTSIITHTCYQNFLERKLDNMANIPLWATAWQYLLNFGHSEDRIEANHKISYEECTNKSDGVQLYQM